MSTEERELIEAVGLSPIAMVVSNPRRPDNPLEIVNQAFCSLTGYSEDEIVGRNCRFLAGEQTDESATEEIRSAIRDARPLLIDITNYRRDRTAFRNGVMITPLFDPHGKLAWFLGSQVDLGPAHDSVFRQRRSRATELVESLPPRRRQVLQLMAAGLLNKQIAWELKISEKTVKMHRALLLEDLGVATSAEAIRVAVEADL
ncbi:MAG TPA: LuxR C-terminal-related transcriptional regulator [Sphingomicrobium sp.]|nr:LuxR C-terminal-related transcriptional regulator [Sphingomicrobium sp.]